MAKPLGGVGGSIVPVKPPKAPKVNNFPAAKTNPIPRGLGVKPPGGPGKISGFGAAAKAGPKLPKPMPPVRTGPRGV